MNCSALESRISTRASSIGTFIGTPRIAASMRLARAYDHDINREFVI
jgi:hypothetical protein